MPTYDCKEFTFTLNPARGGFVDSRKFREMLCGEWNPKLSREEKLDPKNIKKVIFNPPATIVIFKDDTKVVVKTSDKEHYDPEKGFLMAMARIMFESRAEFNRLMDKNLNECKENLKGYWYFED